MRYAVSHIRFIAVSALGLALAVLQGCHPVMSTSPQSSAPATKADNTVADWPFKFKRHDFGAACYSTYGCKLRYDGFLHLDQPDDELQPSSESIGPDYLEYLDGGYLGIKNFPPPADIRWRSKDGQAHHAVIDIGEIFKDQLIRHKVPKEDVAEDTSVPNPAIVIEVNDRTVNVYIRSRIPTKREQIPGNQYSYFRDEPILAFTKSY